MPGRRKSKRGLYANIQAKRKRIAAGSGEKMRKPGSEGAPSQDAFAKSEKTAKKTKPAARKRPAAKKTAAKKTAAKRPAAKKSAAKSA